MTRARLFFNGRLICTYVLDGEKMCEMIWRAAERGATILLEEHDA